MFVLHMQNYQINIAGPSNLL